MRTAAAALAAIVTMSYSLYLTHRLIFTAFLSIAATFLLSIVTYHLIERPGMAPGKQLTLRNSGRTS